MPGERIVLFWSSLLMMIGREVPTPEGPARRRTFFLKELRRNHSSKQEDWKLSCDDDEWKNTIYSITGRTQRGEMFINLEHR